MDKNYVVYHLHTDLSLLDSCTNYKSYIDRAVELGMKAICITEHGNIYEWVEKKLYCDKKGIKYLHGCEMYLTETHDEKIRDNYHTILIAKNTAGVKELNTLIDLSTRDDHFYYKNRLSFEEFLNISDNIIKISSCLASPLSKLNESNEYYERLLMKYDYYEIQYHKDRKGDQIGYNRKLYDFSKKYNKPLIAGTDTHSINAYKAECRSILKKAKKMSYEDEDSYDLTFKSYEELVDKFKEQNSLPIEVILEAIENTNVLADSCEEVILDTTVKYPKLADDEDFLFESRICEKLGEKMKKGIIPKDKRYLDRLREEIRVFKKLGMSSFMTFMSELCTWCEENGIPRGFARGSVAGSLVAYVLDIIDLDAIKWKTVFSRFCNEDRMELGDIDIDFNPSQRELVYKYIIERFGRDKSAYILAIGTISDKGTIDDIGRALGYPLDMVAKIKEEYDKNQEETKSRYSELFYYFDGMLGCAVSQSVHPAGIVASPVTLPDNYGTFWKDGNRIMQINMEEIHEVNLLKYDILGLKNIGIIKDTCEFACIPYPKSHSLNWNDEEVWSHLCDSPVGIFQMEADYAYNLLKKFGANKINDLSLVNASLRPSGASYRDKLIARVPSKNPSELIDKLLAENNGYLVFQEDIIAFLQEICGLSGSEADNIRRAIGRKDKDRLDKAMPRILEGYCSKSDKPREIAQEEAKEFLQIIEDASSYMFGFNHSTAYSMIGYVCAYLRYYYPVEFVAAYLNNAEEEEDIQNGTLLAGQLNIKINPPVFRYSKAKYFPDKGTNSIYKGIGSIKYLNEKVGDELYDLRNNSYKTFVELLEDINTKTSLDSRQLDILIRLGFFGEFGGAKYLLDIVNIFNKLYSKKQFKKAELPFKLNPDIVRSFAGKETEKMFTQVDTKALIEHMISELKNSDITIRARLEAELEYVGYISYKDEKYNKDVAVVTEVKPNKYGTVFTTLYYLKTGQSETVKTDKYLFSNKPLDRFDTIYITSIVEKNKRRKVDGEWVVLEDKERILEGYRRVIDE